MVPDKAGARGEKRKQHESDKVKGMKKGRDDRPSPSNL